MARYTCIIGDAHGCIRTFEALLKQLPHESRIISIGDILDRGPGSYRLFRLVQELGIEMVMGNHEYMFINRHKSEDHLNLWLRNGGDKALEDVRKQHPQQEDQQRALEEMDAFFTQIPHYILLEGKSGKKLLLSHAGVAQLVFAMSNHDLGQALQWQDDDSDSLLWTRQPLASIPDTIQVVGHTPTPDAPLQDGKGNWYIDSGCVYDYHPKMGYLSALVFEEGSWQKPEIIRQKNVE